MMTDVQAATTACTTGRAEQFETAGFTTAIAGVELKPVRTFKGGVYHVRGNRIAFTTQKGGMSASTAQEAALALCAKLNFDVTHAVLVCERTGAVLFF